MLYIEPGSPWENSYIESFNGKLGDELLNREFFYTLLEVKVLTEQYRQTYNHVRPRSSLGYRPPAPEALIPAHPGPSVCRTNIASGTTSGGRSVLPKGMLAGRVNVSPSIDGYPCLLHYIGQASCSAEQIDCLRLRRIVVGPHVAHLWANPVPDTLVGVGGVK